MSLRRDISLRMISCHAKTLKVLEHWSGYSPDMNYIENVWNMIKNEIGNQMLCKMKICGREFVKRGIV